MKEFRALVATTKMRDRDVCEILALVLILAAAGTGGLIWLSNGPTKKKTAPGAATSESGKTSRNG